MKKLIIIYRKNFSLSKNSTKNNSKQEDFCPRTKPNERNHCNAQFSQTFESNQKIFLISTSYEPILAKEFCGFEALIVFPCFCGSNAPLVGKSTWKTVANFLTPGKEKKFNGSHKSCSGISSDHEYVDVSEKIFEELDPLDDVPWRFFKHSESGKLFAENVNETDRYERTALHYATIENRPQVKFAF